MWTDKNHWIVLKLRINRFCLPLTVPILCLDEVIAAIGDLMSLFRFAHPSISLSIKAMEGFTLGLREYGTLDLIDIDTKNADGTFQMKIKLR